MAGLFRTSVGQASATTSGASVSSLAGLSREEGQEQKDTETAPVGLQMKRNLPLQTERNGTPLQTERNLPLQTERNLPLQTERNVPLQTERNLPLQTERNVPLKTVTQDQPISRGGYPPAARLPAGPSFTAVSSPQTSSDQTVPALPSMGPEGANSTAKVPVPLKELVLAGKGAAAGRNALAEPQDFPDGPHIVAFRKAHKVGIFIKVTPQRGEGEVTACFKVKRDFNNLAAPVRPMEESDQGTEVIGLTPRVELSLGPRPR
ncbi:Dynactin subunit 4 [Plecturocebus cupreus]